VGTGSRASSQAPAQTSQGREARPLMGKVIKAFRKRNAKRHFPYPWGWGPRVPDAGGLVKAACGVYLPHFKVTENYAKLTCKRCKRIARKRAARRGEKLHRG
jgi:hypothetical protein